jgi:hypothetical protein
MGGDSGGGGSSASSSTTANPFEVRGGLFDSTWDGSNLDVGFADAGMQRVSDMGKGGAYDFLDMARNNETADMAGLMGQNFLGQLGAQGSSAQDIMMQQFGMMNPLLQKQQERDFLNMESRLNSQGRLDQQGVGSGSGQMQGLFDSQGDQTTKLMYDSLGQGMNYQNHLFNLGSGLSQLDPALRGSFQNLGTGMLNIPMSMQNAMFNQAGVAGNLAGATQTGSGNNGQLGMTETIGAGLINSGVNNLANQASNWFQPSGSSGSGYGDDFDAWAGL